jgi:hypothetical protein
MKLSFFVVLQLILLHTVLHSWAYQLSKKIAKTQKALCFDTLMEIELFTKVQAQASQHRTIQLKSLDLPRGRNQGMYADSERLCW